MDQDDVRSLLATHMADLRRLVELRRGIVTPEEASAQLEAFWKSACHLARLMDEVLMSPQQQEMAVALVRLSRETVALKKHEFQIHGGLDRPNDLFEDEGGGRGGAPVGAWIRSGPPPKSGHDAKAFPPDEIERYACE
jgi:hypothetical protein